MKSTFLNKTYSLIFFLFLTVSAFADDNPEEPPEDVTDAPISDFIWILAIIGIVYVFLKMKKLKLAMSNSLRNKEQI